MAARNGSLADHPPLAHRWSISPDPPWSNVRSFRDLVDVNLSEVHRIGTLPPYAARLRDGPGEAASRVALIKEG